MSGGFNVKTSLSACEIACFFVAVDPNCAASSFLFFKSSYPIEKEIGRTDLLPYYLLEDRVLLFDD